MGNLKTVLPRSGTASRKRNASGKQTDRGVMDVKNANVGGDVKGTRTGMAQQAEEIEEMFALIDANLADAERRTDRLLARTT